MRIDGSFVIRCETCGDYRSIKQDNMEIALLNTKFSLGNCRCGTLIQLKYSIIITQMEIEPGGLDE